MPGGSGRKTATSFAISQSQIAEGILRAERLAGSDVLTSGSNSVIRPWGSGFALFTRRNWSRCSSTSSATKALMGMIRFGLLHFDRATARCWPSTIQAGFFCRPLGRGISRVPAAARPSSTAGPRL